MSLKLSSITVGIAILYHTTFILPSLAIAIRDNKKVAFESALFSGNHAKIVDARSFSFVTFSRRVWPMTSFSALSRPQLSVFHLYLRNDKLKGARREVGEEAEGKMHDL